MPAFLVHGVPDTSVLWDDVCAHLGRTDVIRPDLPGFTDAPMPDGFEPTKEGYAAWLVGELEAVGEPVDLVGHDWGSILVVRAATTRPDLIRTLTCGGGPVDPDYVWHDTAQLWQTPEVGEQVMEAIAPDTMGAALSGMGLTPDQAERTASHITPSMKDCILTLYRSAVTVGAEWAPAMDGFERPALVFWGADDPYAQAVPFAQNMADRLGGRAVLFEGCQHWWPAERAADVAAELERLWS